MIGFWVNVGRIWMGGVGRSGKTLYTGECLRYLILEKICFVVGYGAHALEHFACTLFELVGAPKVAESASACSFGRTGDRTCH